MIRLPRSNANVVAREGFLPELLHETIFFKSSFADAPGC